MSKLKKKAKETNNQELILAIDDRDAAAAFEAVAASQGGELLVRRLSKTVIKQIEYLAANYSKLSLQEFTSIGATVNSTLTILRLLTRAEDEKKMIDEVIEKELVKEL